MALYKDQVDDPLSRLWLHYFKSMNCFKISLHMSARTKEANIPSSCAKRLSGVSYSKIIPRFITITRSAVRIVWTRCCEWKKTCYLLHILRHKLKQRICIFHQLFRDIYLPWGTRRCKKHSPSNYFLMYHLSTFKKSWRLKLSLVWAVLNLV